MNYRTQLSIELANQRDYLDQLFKVYPTVPDTIREVDDKKWWAVERQFEQKDASALVKTLLSFDLFPIKDSYVAYLKRDIGSIDRNPRTINRLSGRLYEMGLEKIYDRCSEPKETNRQIWPMFRRRLQKWTLGFPLLPLESFTSSEGDAILDCGDEQLKTFASENLSYDGTKWLDFVARVNGQYVIGESKFLTDFGGHQNAQFNDAITLLNSDAKAVKIAILDGVLYIKWKNKMHKFLELNPEMTIISSLVLREFLHQL